jgi:diguanylate cyclase (GGDEF)-like protein/PAS domain S-box-containing protein
MLADSMITSIRDMMITGNAMIVPDWAKGIKKTRGVSIIQVLRKDGKEAFSDNSTIEKVNGFLDEKTFPARLTAYFEKSADFEGFNLYPVDMEKLAEAVAGRKRRFSFDAINGERQLTLLAPVIHEDACTACHGYDKEKVLAVVRISMPTAEMDAEIKSELTNKILFTLGTGLGIALLFALYTVRLLGKIREGEENMRISAQVYENTMEGIMVTDVNANIISANPAFSRITGYNAEEVVGKNPSILQSGKHGAEFYKEMWNKLLTEGQWAGEIWNKRKDGELYAQQVSISAVKDERGKLTEYVAVTFDITEQKRKEEIIRFMAYHDHLTGLPNRNTFNNLLGAELSNAKRYRHKTAVMFLDLDGFKQVNDTCGHGVGDALLKEVSKMLKASVRESDTVARMGGDEFTILLPRVNSEDDARKVANKIISLFSNPVEIEMYKLNIGTSIGMAVYPDDGEEPAILIKQADEAMYRAKQGGKNRLEMYRRESDKP